MVVSSKWRTDRRKKISRNRMTRQYLIYFLLLIATCFYSQTNIPKIKIKKGVTDTIDYKNVTPLQKYKLTYKTVGKNYIDNTCNPLLSFSTCVGIDSTYLSRSTYDNGKSFRNSDTVIHINWYRYSDTECLGDNCCHGRPFCKLKINRTSDIFVIYKQSCTLHKKSIMLKFRVKKFSRSELVLEEINDKKVKTTYFFYLF